MLRGGLTAALLLIGSAATGTAEDITPLWQNVGNWQVRVDTSLGHGCFMLAGYDNGAFLRVGFDNIHNVGYLMIGSEKWRSLEVGKNYTVSFQYNGLQPVEWTGAALKLGTGASGVIDFPFNNAAIWTQLAQRTSLSVNYQGKFVVGFSLAETGAAIKTVFECNSQFTASDPSAATVSDDPFAAQ